MISDSAAPSTIVGIHCPFPFKNLYHHRFAAASTEGTLVGHLQRSTDTFRIMTGLISIYGGACDEATGHLIYFPPTTATEKNYPKNIGFRQEYT